VICVTSDKCYENREWDWPYRESDPMGGYDPYSGSKGCAELVVSAWRRSFFHKDGPGLASVRAGNVIGGGDWAEDRLVPDLVRAFERGEAPVIRSPASVRPWQHVLEALGGYMMIAQRLLDGERRFADAWNFGPVDEDARPVRWIVDRMRAGWQDGVPSEVLDGARARTKPGSCGSTARARGRCWAGVRRCASTRRSRGSSIGTSGSAPGKTPRGQSRTDRALYRSCLGSGSFAAAG
jgi:CDP-glucose 4,6-dehydratase